MMPARARPFVLLVVAMLALALVPNTAANHDDPIPEPVQVIVCTASLLPDGMCQGDDLDVYAFPMVTVLGPVCEASENQPAEVCILRFFTLGQALCMVRALAPGAGVVLVCSGGHIVVTCGSTVPGEMVSQWVTDLDCDGHSNVSELEHGCDPLDPQSRPIGPMECSEGGGGTDPSGLVGCSGSDDPLVILAEILADADCDGHSNMSELEHGCNPLDATQYPGAAAGCDFLTAPPVPAPGELPVDPDELPLDPSELPLDPDELPLDPSELPLDPDDLPIPPV